MKYLLLAGFIAVFLSACGGGTSDMDYDIGTFDSVLQKVNWNTEVTIQLDHTAGAKYKIEQQPKNGSVMISNNGLVTYMPNIDFVGHESFKVSARNRTSEGIHVLFTTMNISVEKMPLSTTETSFIFYDYQPITGKLIAKNAVGKPTFTTAFTSSDETFELQPDGSFTFQRTNKKYSNLLYLTSIPITIKDNKSTTTQNISFNSKPIHYFSSNGIYAVPAVKKLSRKTQPVKVTISTLVPCITKALLGTTLTSRWSIAA